MSIARDNINNEFQSEDTNASLVKVLSQYAPLVKSRALRFLSSNFELDDLIQEGNIGLLLAYLKYDKNISGFSTFARRCIDASIIDYLRKNSKLSSIPADMLVDISDFPIPDMTLTPEYLFYVKDEYNRFIKEAESQLSQLEFSVFKNLLHGYGHSEIAHRLNVSDKSVNNAIQRIRAKLQQPNMPK